VENVQAISFNQEVVEAGSVRLQPEEAKVIQKDQLEPKVMQAFGGLIAYATMDGIVTYMGSQLTQVHYSFIKNELGWILPAGLTNDVEEKDGEEKTLAPAGEGNEKDPGEPGPDEGGGSEPGGSGDAPEGGGEGSEEGGEGGKVEEADGASGGEDPQPVTELKPPAEGTEEDDFVPGEEIGAGMGNVEDIKTLKLDKGKKKGKKGRGKKR